MFYSVWPEISHLAHKAFTEVIEHRSRSPFPIDVYITESLFATREVAPAGH